MRFSERIPTLIRFGHFLRSSLPGFGRFLRNFPRNFLSAMGRFLWKNLRRIVFAVACVVTLVALVFAEETYRTAKAWENYQAAANARGEKLTLTELAPRPVPDDQNFAMTPLLKPLFTDPNYPAQLKKRLEFTNESPGFGQRESGQRIDLEKWAKYFQQPDVLTALKKYDPEMAEISTALRRPYSRFPIVYDNAPDRPTNYYHLGPLLNLSKMFSLRSVAELAAGKSDEALADTLMVLRLSQATRDEPFFTARFNSDRILRLSLQIVWEGLAAHRWTDAQLSTLQQEMQKNDLLPQYLLAVEGVRTSFCDGLMWLSRQDLSERKKIFKDFQNGQELNSQVVPLLSLPRLAIYRALVVGNTWYESLFRVINVADHRFDLEQLWASMLESRRWTADNDLTPGDPYLGLFPAYDKVIPEFAYTQSSLDQAVVACALERYRLAHGSYPEKLEELSPQFIAKLPHDDVSGEPLHYHRTPDGQFILYSVGRDGKDHGGVVDPKNKWGYIDGGNWVWQYPAS
jgi:hypothetical protein